MTDDIDAVLAVNDTVLAGYVVPRDLDEVLDVVFEGGAGQGPTTRALTDSRVWVAPVGTEPGESGWTEIGTALTGSPSDALIIDDPVRGRKEADSTAMREDVWNWWKQVRPASQHAAERVRAEIVGLPDETDGLSAGDRRERALAARRARGTGPAKPRLDGRRR